MGLGTRTLRRWRQRGGEFWQWWHHWAAGQLILLFLVSIPNTVLSGPGPAQPWTARASSAAIGSLIMAFLLWRVWDGGHFSRQLLLAGSFVAYVGGLFALAREWDLLIAARLGFALTCLAVLTGPAIRLRLRGLAPASGAPVSGAAVAPGLWLRPPAWLLPWALVAGITVTLLFLAQMGAGQVPGCGVPGTAMAQLPERCLTLWRGYPLRFLAADQGNPLLVTASLLKDWLQWSLVSGSALYAAWRTGGRPSPRAKGGAPAA